MSETGKERKSQTSEGEKRTVNVSRWEQNLQMMKVYSGVNRSHVTSEVKLNQ